MKTTLKLGDVVRVTEGVLSRYEIGLNVKAQVGDTGICEQLYSSLGPRWYVRWFRTGEQSNGWHDDYDEDPPNIELVDTSELT